MTKSVEVFWLESCNKCGHGWAIVNTEEGTEDFLFDGDKITCKACGHTGHVAVTDDYAEDCVAYAVWDEISKNTIDQLIKDDGFDKAFNDVFGLPEAVVKSLKEVS